MKSSKFISITALCLVLNACVGTNSSSNDVQNLSANGNLSGAPMTITGTATGCRAIAANNGSCTINLAFSAPSGNLITTPTQLVMLNLPASNYTTNFSQNCTGTNYVFSTTTTNCSFTINSTGSTNTSQQISITPSLPPYTGNSAYTVVFTLGGGYNNNSK
jgi:hypothetical protein